MENIFIVVIWEIIELTFMSPGMIQFRERHRWCRIEEVNYKNKNPWKGENGWDVHVSGRMALVGEHTFIPFQKEGRQ